MVDQELCYTTNGCLQRHKVTSTLRAKMIDWMLEVLNAYKQEDQTFFLAVSIHDRYLKCAAKELVPTDLHLIGVTCMFIASKYEDYRPLKMQEMFKNICKEQYSIE